MIQGLKDVEYRGYCNAGVLIKMPDSTLNVIKSVGDVDKLKPKLSKLRENKSEAYPFAMGHVRWRTHGEANLENCHPHNSNKEFFVVHNGILTDFANKKKELQDLGYKFTSDTDTEIIAHLAHKYYKSSKEKTYLHNIVYEISHYCKDQTSFMLVSEHFPKEAALYMYKSPLYIGLIVENGYKIPESFDVYDQLSEENPNISKKTKLNDKNNKDVKYKFVICSDIDSFGKLTNKYIVLCDNDIVHIKSTSFKIYNLSDNNSDKKVREVQISTPKTEDDDMRGFKEFMKKEIFDQPSSLKRCLEERISTSPQNINIETLNDEVIERIRNCHKIVIIGCGTSYNSGLAVKDLIQELTNKDVAVEIATAFLDETNAILNDNSTYIFISQSGETADTLAALQKVRKSKALCIGIVNKENSLMPQLTDFKIPLNVGIERGVASTKAYTTQFAALVLLAIQVGQNNKNNSDRIKAITECLVNISTYIEETLKLDDYINSIVKKNLIECQSLMVVGRGYHNATRLEGALKIKEITYIPTEGILGGELKHGSLALVDDKKFIVVLYPDDYNKDQMESSYQQIIANKGKTIVITAESMKNKFKDQIVIIVPKVVDCLQGIIDVIPMQLISYHLAKPKGLNVDKPRNLAKSVTTK